MLGTEAFWSLDTFCILKPKNPHPLLDERRNRARD